MTQTPDDPQASIDMEKFTKSILILAIIGVSATIIYTMARPEEEYAVFSILNQDQELGNFISEISVNTTFTFYYLVENHFDRYIDIQVRFYEGKNTTINPYISLEGNENVTLQLIYNHTIQKGQELISPINHSFNTIGTNQSIILELWTRVDGIWTYLENYVVFNRIDVY